MSDNKTMQDVQQELLNKIHEALVAGSWELVDIYTQAFQRINFSK